MKGPCETCAAHQARALPGGGGYCWTHMFWVLKGYSCIKWQSLDKLVARLFS